jgi:hypothetical protein
MPDTPENQEAFPQLRSQRPGAGSPIACVCAVLSLATACVCDMAIGPFEGKETGETALLRGLLETFERNDVAAFDRHYCSFMMLALLSLREIHVYTPAAPILAYRLPARSPTGLGRPPDYVDATAKDIVDVSGLV